MNETEIYNYFKSRTDTFNEMPSTELWGKISANLDNVPKNSTVKSLLPKLFLLVAMIIGASIALTDRSAGPEKGNQTVILKDSVSIKADSVKKVRKDTLKSKPTSFIHFKKQPQPKIQSKPIVYFNEKPVLKVDSIYKPTPFRAKDAEIKNTTYRLQDSIPKPIEIADSEIVNTNKRVVITSAKKLSKAEFDEFTQRAIKASSHAKGKLLIVKAIGHRPFRSIISNSKTDTIPKLIFELPAQKIIFFKDSVK